VHVRAVLNTRVVEVAAHSMRPIKRLYRPAVGRRRTRHNKRRDKEHRETDAPQRPTIYPSGAKKRSPDRARASSLHWLRHVSGTLIEGGAVGSGKAALRAARLPHLGRQSSALRAEGAPAG